MLVDSQQPPYGPIYSLGPIELEILKAYIETNLANGFMRPSKSPNWYPLSLVRELLGRLERAGRFTQLDFTSAYYQIRVHKENKWTLAFQTQYGHFKY